MRIIASLLEAQRLRRLGGRALLIMLLAGCVLSLRCASATHNDAFFHGKVPVYIRVIPDNDVLQVDLNQTGQKAFQVQAFYDDGNSVDVTVHASLKLSNTSIGSLDGSTFTSVAQSSARIDLSRVEATLQFGETTLSSFANLTVVWLRTSGPAKDFFFALPKDGAVEEQPLDFSTNIQNLDSFFAVDTTASMAPSIIALRDSLQTTIIPGVRAAAVKEAWFGVGAVEDFGVAPYGAAGCTRAPPGGTDDQPFILLNPMTRNTSLAQIAVGSLLNSAMQTRGCGGDIPEGQLEALYQIATGVGNIVPGVVNIPSHRIGLGGVEFRAGALPVITLITDAMFHGKGEGGTCRQADSTGTFFQETRDYAAGSATSNSTHTRAEATAAINQICGKAIGVSVIRTTVLDTAGNTRFFPDGYCTATNDLIQLATATGAIVPPVAWDLPSRPGGCPSGQCCTGLNGAGEPPNGQGECPLVFKIADNGSGLGAQVTSGITQLARFIKFEVTTSVSGSATGDQGETLPAGKTAADFLKGITPFSATPPPPPPTIAPPVISGGRFTGVTAGSTVRFTVDAQNDFQPQTTSPQIFRATIRIQAGGCTDLDQREVIILIPPMAPQIG